MQLNKQTKLSNKNALRIAELNSVIISIIKY